MGIADDFIASFFSKHPEARSGDLSMDELNALMSAHQLKKNSAPLDDFDGLSPEEMNSLLYYPMAEGGTITFRPGFGNHLDKIPLFQLSEMLILHIHSAGSVKLTAKGNLPLALCELLYSQNQIQWEYMNYTKKVQEDTIPFIWPLKEYVLSQGIIKKRNNTLSLTKKGKKFLLGPPSERFLNLFFFFTYHFHWGNFYRLEDGGKSGHFGWAYSLYLLSKYGNFVHSSSFYSLKVIQAFEPQLWTNYHITNNQLMIDDYQTAYAVRFFDNFARWFGLVNIERINDYHILYAERYKITKSVIFDQLFQVKSIA